MWGFWCTRMNLDGNCPTATMSNPNMYSFVGNPSISWEPQKGELHLSNTKRKFSTMDKSGQICTSMSQKVTNIHIILYELWDSWRLFSPFDQFYTFVSNVILDMVFFGICSSSQATLPKMTVGCGIQKIFLEQENNGCSFPRVFSTPNNGMLPPKASKKWLKILWI